MLFGRDTRMGQSPLTDHATWLNVNAAYNLDMPLGPVLTRTFFIANFDVFFFRSVWGPY